MRLSMSLLAILLSAHELRAQDDLHARRAGTDAASEQHGRLRPRQHRRE
jgi:hypothetical protein